MTESDRFACLPELKTRYIELKSRPHWIWTALIFGALFISLYSNFYVIDRMTHNVSKITKWAHNKDWKFPVRK